MSAITTYTGKEFDPTKPDKALIDIRDIAHALSLLCRANGHFKEFYSVAMHSVNCCREALARGYSERIALACLLHDASESYLSDITRPVKKELPRYLEIEKNLQDAVWSKWFDPVPDENELRLVFEIDDAMLWFEFLCLMNKRKHTEDEPKLFSTPNFSFEPFSKTESDFLYLFNSLTNGEASYIGVDWGGRHGWIAAELCGTFLSISSYSDISSLCKAFSHIENIIIDIPIGLPETGTDSALRPDKAARDYLIGTRKSTLFNVPLKPVIYASTPQEAWDLNREFGGKLTPQGLALSKIIREVDSFLQENPEWKNRLLESHPEVAFQMLNGGKGLVFSKHSEEGLDERRDILKRYDIAIENIPQSGIKQDDILDAACLALVSKLGHMKGFSSIPEFPNCDDTGLKMQITLANI